MATTIAAQAADASVHQVRLIVRPERIDALDWVRGLVMVIMALDHVRDFVAMPALLNPEDLSHGSPLLFFTRWITHFCAPAFFFLAGTGAFLSLQRGMTKPQLSRFLLTRGLWLMALEWTVCAFGWTFIPFIPFVIVIFQLGFCMVTLAALIHLPLRWLAATSLLVIGLHNLLDPITGASVGAYFSSYGQGAATLATGAWKFLHELGAVGRPPILVIAYPAVPWFAVMAAGYCFGAICTRPPKVRQRLTLWMGLGITALFLLLRGFNLYGNATLAGWTSAGPWSGQATALLTLCSFLNVQKYPPSLHYLAMSLGPTLLAIALADRLRPFTGWFSRKVLVFGRVPFFYYLLHIYLIHLLALGLALATGQPAAHLGWRGGGFFLGRVPSDYGFGLGTVYAMWLVAIVILYFPCAWYAGFKRTHPHNRWLRYL